MKAHITKRHQGKPENSYKSDGNGKAPKVVNLLETKKFKTPAYARYKQANEANWAEYDKTVRDALAQAEKQQQQLWAKFRKGT